MAWIESHQSLLTHRKTGRLARALGVSKITAIGHLHAFWWWCLDNAPDGVLVSAGRPADVQDISDGACWDGPPDVLIHALIHAGFVDQNDDVLSVHDWMEYAGRLIIRRAADAERKRVARQQQEHVQRTSKRRRADGVRTVPNRTQPNLTKEREATAIAAPVSLSLIKNAENAEPEIAAPSVPDPQAARDDEQALLEAWCKAIGTQPKTSAERRQWVKALAGLQGDVGLKPSECGNLVDQYRAKFHQNRTPTPGQVAAVYSQLGVSPHVYAANGTDGVVRQHHGSQAAQYPENYAERRQAAAAARRGSIPAISAPASSAATAAD